MGWLWRSVIKLTLFSDYSQPVNLTKDSGKQA
jgi:hypothetical protein